MTGRVSARNTGIQLRTQPLAADPRQAAEKDKACAALSVRGKRSTRPVRGYIDPNGPGITCPRRPMPVMPRPEARR